MGTRTILRVSNWQGGVNEYDPPLEVPEDQVVAAYNVEFQDGALGAKRYGSTTGSFTWAVSSFGIASLMRHTPTTDDAQAELWAVSFRGAGGVAPKFARATPTALAFTEITPDDQVDYGSSSVEARSVVGASFNGKLFLAYHSAQDRLHVWDGTDLRRAGLPTGTLISGSVSGGAVTDSRKYRGVPLRKSGTTVVSRGEPVAAGEADASLSSQQYNVSLMAVEDATHWELQVASDDDDYATWYVVGEAEIDQSITDNNATLTDLEVAYSTGLFGTLPSAKFVLTDENRLLLAGSWETTAHESRVWWTPVLGSLDQGDDERLVETSTISSHLDLDRGDGGEITGIGGPLLGAVYVFKATHIYKLVRTGVVNNPYEAIPISKSVGCLKHQTIVLGEDETGAPALYFISREGPYRLGVRGLEFLGTDIQATWATVNRQAVHLGFGVWHPQRRQVWWWLTESPYAQPTMRLRFDVRRGVSTPLGVRKGWTRDSGYVAGAHCGVAFAKTPGSSMSYDLVPYVVPSGSVLSAGGWVLRCDVEGTYTDGDGETAYQSYVTGPPRIPDGFDSLTTVTGGALVARTMEDEAPTVRVSLIRDWGVETRVEDVWVDGAHPGTSQVLELRQLTCPDATAIQVQIGESAAASEGYQIDHLVLSLKTQAPR